MKLINARQTTLLLGMGPAEHPSNSSRATALYSSTLSAPTPHCCPEPVHPNKCGQEERTGRDSKERKECRCSDC